jgi:hypothetical protein
MFVGLPVIIRKLVAMGCYKPPRQGALRIRRQSEERFRPRLPYAGDEPGIPRGDVNVP